MVCTLEYVIVSDIQCNINPNTLITIINVSVIIWKRVCRRETDDIIFYGFLQLGISEVLGIRICTIWPHISPDKLIIHIYQTQQYNWMESLVIVNTEKTFLGTSNGDMFSIQGSQGMMKLSFLTEEIGYHCPFVGRGGTSNHFLLILLDDGWVHFADNADDGFMSYPEIIHQEMIAVSCSQKPQGDVQPQTRVPSLHVEGILLGDYWSKSVEQHSWFYSDKGFWRQQGPPTQAQSSVIHIAYKVFATMAASIFSYVPSSFGS